MSKKSFIFSWKIIEPLNFVLMTLLFRNIGEGNFSRTSLCAESIFTDIFISFIYSASDIRLYIAVAFIKN